MVICIFSIFEQKYPLWANLVQNICQLKLKVGTWGLGQICRIQWWCSLFSFLTKNTLFGKIWSKNPKFSVEVQIWYLDYFEYAKFNGDVYLSVLDLFSVSFSKKCIWYFDITWLISQQFNRRDLRPMTFLVLIKNWKNSNKQLLCKELVPYFDFPGYQSWSAIVKFLFKP